MIERIAWLLAVLALFVIPIGLLLLKNFASRWTILALIFFLANALYAVAYLAPWEIWGLWLLRGLSLIGAVAIAIGLYRLVKSSWQRPGWLALAASVFVVLGGAYLAYLNVRSVQARNLPSEPVALQWPLEDGRYYVVQGGAAPPLQRAHASTGARAYAVDLVKMGPALHAYRDFLDYDFAESQIWDAPVYAPCDGEIEWARDGMPDGLDYDPDERKPAGNVVSIKCQGVSVQIPHFRQDSIAVEVGQRVVAGDLLGRIGNSGSASGPHLHIHAERGPLKEDYSDNTPVPITFNGRFLSRGDIYEAGR
ncbi:hypothetical protein NAP1_00910 [Erythrobacter sp. NAP1]|uniref:M23 family metallopeptidase n=1 Tax=Erythrobacter sp. NAP1 TaxID=237727 RepID=UPI0000686BBB|nr:peptidoglycan DD-metalloendopeptidase family protein [Erythrobacter sp. NAP1]EAQ29288.1 hypothetical protein NAP1_00910 [Erythrobacter sp. NAP1]